MNGTSQQKNLDQQRAERAWQCITEVVGCKQNFKKEYGSLARKTPTLVLTNGLGQTLAFLKSKGKNDPNNEHTVVFRHLSGWVLSQMNGNNRDSNLLDWLLNNDSNAYRRATVEALAFLNWLKRFAEAELPTDEQED